MPKICVLVFRNRQLGWGRLLKEEGIEIEPAQMMSPPRAKNTTGTLANGKMAGRSRDADFTASEWVLGAQLWPKKV